jgi:hypothetical protein
VQLFWRVSWTDALGQVPGRRQPAAGNGAGAARACLYVADLVRAVEKARNLVRGHCDVFYAGSVAAPT